MSGTTPDTAGPEPADTTGPEPADTTGSESADTTGLSLRERISLPGLVGLVVLWLALWGDVSWANVLSGTLVALLVVVVLPMPALPLGTRFRPLRILALLVRFLGDLTLASVQVAWFALRPGPQPQSSVIRVPLHSDSDLFVAMTAELTSLVPGTLIVEIGRPSINGQGCLYVHALGVHTQQGGNEVRSDVLALERRILRTFATSAALAEYESRCRVDGTSQHLRRRDVERDRSSS